MSVGDICSIIMCAAVGIFSVAAGIGLVISEIMFDRHLIQTYKRFHEDDDDESL